MACSILYNSKARKKIAKGIRKVNDSVKVTLGPLGRNVLIESSFGAPLIVNDGVTIAKSITLSDKFENLGAQLIIEAATKTNDSQGDGTTTAVLLASSLVLKGLEVVEKGVNPVLLKEGLDYYLDVIVDKIKQYSKSVETLDDIYLVASLSSGSSKLGELVKEAFSEVGSNGEVSVEEAKGLETYLDTVIGYSYDRGYSSIYMITDDNKQMAILDNPHILVCDLKINSMKELMPYLENSINTNRPLLIVCDDISQEVLNTIVMNKLRGVFNVVVTKAPSFGNRKVQYLTDIAKVANATLVTEMTPLKSDLNILGSARVVQVTQNQTTIIDGSVDPSELLDYVEKIKDTLALETSSYEQSILKQRISKLLGGICIIKIGGKTEVELTNNKLRLEDAICAAKASIASGIIPGAGRVLYEISDSLELVKEYEEAYYILKDVLKEPFKQIVINSGCDVDEVISSLSSGKWFDAKLKSLYNVEESRIVDPTSVEISALSTSISIAGVVLTTECAIIKNDDQTLDEKEDL